MYMGSLHHIGIVSSVEDITATIVPSDERLGSFIVQALKNAGHLLPVRGEETFWIATRYMPTPSAYESSNHTDSASTTEMIGDAPPNVAEVYVAYYDPCGEGRDLYANISLWKAYKGTFNLCLQTMLSNTTDGIMNTTIVNEHTDILKKAKDGWSWCGKIDNQGPEYCGDGPIWARFGMQLAQLFNGSASMKSGGDNYVYDESIIQPFNDILGSKPTFCPNSSKMEHLGIKGFEMRLNNVATSITNA